MVGAVFDGVEAGGVLVAVVVGLEGFDEFRAAGVDVEARWGAVGGFEAGADEVEAGGGREVTRAD